MSKMRYQTNMWWNYKLHLGQKTLCDPSLSHVRPDTNNVIVSKKNTGIEPNLKPSNHIPNEVQTEVMKHTNIGVIYLLAEREFMSPHLPLIVKIGRTSKEMYERLRGYTKNAVVIATALVENHIEAEKMLKVVFSQRLTARDDIGSEYFSVNAQSRDETWKLAYRTFFEVAAQCHPGIHEYKWIDDTMLDTSKDYTYVNL